MTTGVRLEGVERCLGVLRSLPRKVQKRVLQKAVRAGGNPFLKAARSRAPTRNRLLKSSLALVIRTYDATVLAIIGQEKTKAFFKVKNKRRQAGGISGRGELTPIHLVEEPVKPHDITGTRNTTDVSFKDIRGRARTKKVAIGRILRPLAIATAGGKLFRQRVRHPGHKGRHFIRAAAAQAEQAGLAAFEQKYVEELMKEA